MADRERIAWFVLLIGLAATIYFFIRQDDRMALNVLFLTIYLVATIIYFMRVYFYLQHNATLNEVYFFSLANIVPLFVIAASTLVPIGREGIVTFFIDVEPMGSSYELNFTLLSILAFPYLTISTALLIRSFTRYKIYKNYSSI
jgi:hypothetical protein